MRLRFLGQTGIPVVLEKGHLYRGRVLAPCIPGAGTILRAALLNLGSSFGFPADLVVYESASSLPADWPADRKGTGSGGECPLWWQARAALDRELDLSQLQAVAPVGGRVVEIWDQTTGAVLFGETLPNPEAPPGPGDDLPFPQTVPGPIPLPFPVPGTTPSPIPLPLPVPTPVPVPVPAKPSPELTTGEKLIAYGPWVAAGIGLLRIMWK